MSSDNLNLVSHEDAPLGMVLPFHEDSIPEEWLAFNGQSLDEAHYSDLWELLQETKDGIKEYWELMGGALNSDVIVLPDVDSEKVSELMRWPRSVEGTTLAIKAKRTLISDNAGDTSQVPSDDSDQG